MGERPPKNRERTRDYFRWDDRQHQPHADMTNLEKIWVQREDWGSLLALIGRNLGHAWPVYRAYRAIAAAPEVARRVGEEQLGVAIAADAATLDRSLERVQELGVRTLLVRVPCWDPGPALSLVDRLAALHRAGYRFVFDFLQDRDAVREPARWGRFVSEAAAAVAPLAPAIQIGHATNRKKWGIWHPSEYHRLLEATAPAREAHPACTWLGPAVIDFEYHVTLSVLYGRRPFDFGGVSALLYVDRRGSPEARQYRHFDLRRKVLLLEALVGASPQPDVPLWLTEFNWPLVGTGAHSPAGSEVMVSEAHQADFGVLYVLHALAAAPLGGLCWWQMVAKGYGLCDEDPEWRRRPVFAALAALQRCLAGATLQRLVPRRDGLSGFVIRADGQTTIELHTRRGEIDVRLARRPVVAAAVTGERVACQESRRVTMSPLFVSFASDDAEDVLAALGLEPSATRGGE